MPVAESAEVAGESASATTAAAAAAAAEADKKQLLHYKKLIMQSRQMLESYQRQLGEKDRLIQVGCLIYFLIY